MKAGKMVAPDEIATRSAAAGLCIAAVVVTHNRLDQLRVTAARLLDEGVDHLLIVDNASTDGTRAWLEAHEDPRLFFIPSDNNLGGAGGFELGLRTACKRFDADWYVLMDDDARPHDGVIPRFRKQLTGQAMALAAEPGAEAGRAGPPTNWCAFAGGVYFPDGSICETNRPSLNPFWDMASFMRTTLGGGRAGFHVADADYERTSPRRIHAASFVGLFLSREAILKAGYPQGDLFIYGDDVLYTLGLSRSGGQIGFAPWLSFEHDCSTFERGKVLIHRPLWKVYYNYRNGLLAYREAAGPILFWLVLLVCLPKWSMKVRAYRPDERRIFLRLLRMAAGDGIRGRKNRSHAEIRALSQMV